MLAPLQMHFVTAKSRREGFTLIELLLVVAILGVLMLLTFSVAGRLRSNSQSVQCINHLRETGRGLLAYAGENKGVIRSIVGGSASYNAIWPAALFSKQYITAKEVTRCPLGKAPIALTNGGWMWQAYGLNMKPGPHSVIDNNTKLLLLRTMMVENSASFPLVMDSGTSGNPITQTFRVELDAGGMSLRHNQRANVFFLDGHVLSVDQQTAEEGYGFVRFYEE